MLTFPPAATGTGMGMLPVMILNFIIAALIVGEVFYMKTPLFECTALEGATACQTTVLDLVPYSPDEEPSDYSVVRTGRCGGCLIFTGLYLMQAGMNILIPNKIDESKP